MIKNKYELELALGIERKKYVPESRKNSLHLRLLRDHNYLIWKYVEALRYTEYYYNTHNKIMYWIWERTKNKRGANLGITIWQNTIDQGLKIWHYGCIIVNGHAKIGKNCQMHGDNCIGNKGDNGDGAPVIGDNVEIGVGAKIIGPIYIANNVKIGANAVVTKSCYEEGAVLVGVPAVAINKR